MPRSKKRNNHKQEHEVTKKKAEAPQELPAQEKTQKVPKAVNVDHTPPKVPVNKAPQHSLDEHPPKPNPKPKSSRSCLGRIEFVSFSLLAVVLTFLISFYFGVRFWRSFAFVTDYSVRSRQERTDIFPGEHGFYLSFFLNMVNRNNQESTIDIISQYPQPGSASGSVNGFQLCHTWQEIFVAHLYKFLKHTVALPIEKNAVHFLLHFVFGLNGLAVGCLFALGGYLAGGNVRTINGLIQWLLGGLATLTFLCSYSVESTNIHYLPMSREYFCIPLLPIQMLAFSWLLSQTRGDTTSTVSLFGSTIAFCVITTFILLTWQWASFVLLIQMVSVFTLNNIGIIHKESTFCILWSYLFSLGSALFVTCVSPALLYSPFAMQLLFVIGSVAVLGSPYDEWVHGAVSKMFTVEEEVTENEDNKQKTEQKTKHKNNDENDKEPKDKPQTEQLKNKPTKEVETREVVKIPDDYEIDDKQLEPRTIPDTLFLLLFVAPQRTIIAVALFFLVRQVAHNYTDSITEQCHVGNDVLYTGLGLAFPNVHTILKMSADSELHPLPTTTWLSLKPLLWLFIICASLIANKLLVFREHIPKMPTRRITQIYIIIQCTMYIMLLSYISKFKLIGIPMLCVTIPTLLDPTLWSWVPLLASVIGKPARYLYVARVMFVLCLCSYFARANYDRYYSHIQSTARATVDTDLTLLIDAVYSFTDRSDVFASDVARMGALAFGARRKTPYTPDYIHADKHMLENVYSIFTHLSTEEVWRRLRDVRVDYIILTPSCTKTMGYKYRQPIPDVLHEWMLLNSNQDNIPFCKAVQKDKQRFRLVFAVGKYEMYKVRRDGDTNKKRSTKSWITEYQEMVAEKYSSSEQGLALCGMAARSRYYKDSTMELEFQKLAIQLSPKKAYCLCDYAQKLEQKSPKLAKQLYQTGLQALEKQHRYLQAACCNNYAVFLDHTNEVDEARKYYHKAIESWPTDNVMMSNFAAFLWSNSFKDEGAAWAQKSLKRIHATDQALVYCTYSIIMWQSGNKEDARRYMRKALGAPNNEVEECIRANMKDVLTN